MDRATLRLPFQLATCSISGCHLFITRKAVARTFMELNWTELSWIELNRTGCGRLSWRSTGQLLGQKQLLQFQLPLFSSTLPFRCVLGLCNFLWAQLSLWTLVRLHSRFVAIFLLGGFSATLRGWGWPTGGREGETAASFRVWYVQRYFPIKIGFDEEFPSIKYYLLQLCGSN